MKSIFTSSLTLACIASALSLSAQQSELESFELIELRDANTKHFQQSNGTVQAVISGGVVHYLDDQGRYQDIDQSLISGGQSHAYINKTNVLQSFYATDLNNGGVTLSLGSDLFNIGQNSKLVALDANGNLVSDVESASNTSIEVSSNKAIYADLFSDADAEYIVGNGLVKNNIVLNEMPSNIPANAHYLGYSETLTLPEGWSIRHAGTTVVSEQLVSQSLLIFNENNQAMLEIPVPDVYELDHQENAIYADGLWTNGYRITPLGGGQFELATLVPMTWLNESNRNFPVVVDPTITVTGSFGGWQNSSNGYNDATFYVFTANNYSGNTYRAWTKWNISSIPSNALIFDSEVQMYCNGGVTGADTIDVNDVTGTYGNYGAFNSSAYSDFANGNYISFPMNGTGQNYGFYDLGSTCDQDIEDELGNTWFQLAFTMVAGTTNWKRFTATSSSLRVTYLICSGQITGTISGSSLNSAGNHIDCYGDSTASITTTAANGGSTYTYAWTGPNGFTATTSSLSNVGAGVYSVIISSGTVCPAELDTTILGPELMMVNDSVSSYSGYGTSCYDEDDGEIYVTPTGGTSYSYSWSGPSGFTSTTQNNTDLESGWYFVTLTESTFSCEIEDSVYVSPAPYLYLTMDSLENAYCEFDENGSAQATGIGGVQPYTYDWDNGETGMEAVALSAGNHQVTITDAHGCEFTEGFYIEFDNDAPDVSLGGPDTGYCDGGDIILNAGGGYMSYVWDGGATGQLLQVSALGTYTVTVTSFAGCEGEASINVTEVYDLPEPDLGSNINAPLAPVWITPGVYEAYVWSTGSLDSAIAVAVAGTYTVTVTDNHSCQGSDQIKVEFWTTGIEDVDDNGLRIYPNPTIDFLTIQSNRMATDAVIYNAQGQMVYTYPLTGNAVNAQVDVSALPVGLYFIEVRNEGLVGRSSFMKH